MLFPANLLASTEQQFYNIK